MRWIQKRGHQRHRKVPRIPISQAEITADLFYPASREDGSRAAAPAVRVRSGR
jgi:hypothetical protein